MAALPADRNARPVGNAVYYERRRPERPLLYQIIEEYHQAFLVLMSAQCRTLYRPAAVSMTRLSLTNQGHIRYALKTPYRDGTTHVVFELLDFMARLVALVPNPRLNLTRFHEVHPCASPPGQPAAVQIGNPADLSRGVCT
jgi:hypothetical protein